MKTVTSKDGTRIAYDVYGHGQPVIMVGGTMNSRTFGPAPGAQLLGENFAVYDYDRRGRGDSSNNQPYSPSKEIEDIAALVEAAGGKAAVCGFSAGAALAMEAVIELGPERVTKLAMYEAPLYERPYSAKRMERVRPKTAPRCRVRRQRQAGHGVCRARSCRGSISCTQK